MNTRIRPFFLAVALTCAWQTCPSSSLAASPPTDGLALWLTADAGVDTQSPTPVYGWADQAPGGAHSGTPVGTPVLAQATFPNGSHPIIRFNGAAGFNLENDADLELQDFTVYVVASVDNSVASRIFIGHYRDVYGWSMGISDSIAGRIKWWTAPPHSLEPFDFEHHVPTLLTGTRTSDGTKTLYVNSAEAGSVSGLAAIPYGGGELTVGYLQGNRQYLVGDIAEILVFNSVDEFQRAEVEAYLNAKYVQPDPPPDDTPPMTGLVLWLRADAGVNTQTPTPVYRWADQSPNGTHNGHPIGNPTLTEATFANGLHPVIRFNGASGFNIEHGSDLELQDFSVYVVASVDDSVASRIFIGHYRDVVGWSMGISDSVAGRIKWWTAPPHSLEPFDFENHVPALLTGTRSSDGTKTLYVNTAEAGSVSGLAAIPYGNGQLTVGYLEGNRQYLIGDIAEILVCRGVDSIQRTAIEDYLNTKYFWPNPPANNEPPTEDILLWLRADAGVSTEATTPIYGWEDQSASGTHNGSPRGNPTLAYATFPNGSHPIVRFDGASGVTLSNPSGLALSNLSVYVVASADSGSIGKVIVCDYNDYQASPTDIAGWVLGISDDVAGRVKWFTAPPATQSPPEAALSHNTPTLITGTMTSDGTKALYLNTTEVARETGLPSIRYFGYEVLSVGYLIPFRQNFVGDIAEILVFSTVDDTQRAAVEAYLNAKFFLDNPPANNAPPSENLVLWLKADAGVDIDPPTPVYGWLDQSPTGQHHGTPRGQPVLAQGAFPTGQHPVMRFDGASAFDLDNDSALRLQDFSIYVVASVDNSVAARIFLGNYRDVYGWCFGISDGIPGRVKWFTAITPNPGWAGDSLEPAGAALGYGVPTLITATHASDGAKTLYVDTQAVGSSLSAPPIPYYGDEQLTVGCLDWGRQWLVGDIAEILVYSSVSELQRTEVETYLQDKYFNAGPPVITGQPQQVTCLVGDTASFSVIYTGEVPFGVWSYFEDSTELFSVTTDAHAYTLTLPNAQLTNQGNYTFVISNAHGMVTSQVARLEVSYTLSAAAGFSTTANPAGTWSYGYEIRDGGLPSTATFTLYNGFMPASPCPLWHHTSLGTDPNVTYNTTTSLQSCCPGNQIQWDPGEMSIGPGLNGELTVVRWTAPFAGHYDIAASFLDNQENGESADAYVYHNSTQLFAGDPGTVVGSGASYSGTCVSLAAGDTLDFVIGAGADGIATGNHSTLIATITLAQPPNITGWNQDSATQTLTVTFTGTPGLTYRIQFAESLTAPVDWQDVDTQTAAPNGQFSVTINTALTTHGFYRSVYP